MPTVSSELVITNAEMAMFRDTSDTGAVTIRIVSKAPGTANYANIVNNASSAISVLNTAENLLTGAAGRWDAATPAQRDALMLGLTRDVRALIRLFLGLMDQPS